MFVKMSIAWSRPCDDDDNIPPRVMFVRSPYCASICPISEEWRTFRAISGGNGESADQLASTEESYVTRSKTIRKQPEKIGACMRSSRPECQLPVTRLALILGDILLFQGVCFARIHTTCPLPSTICLLKTSWTTPESRATSH